MRLTRHETHHDLEDWTLDVWLSGDPAGAFVEGDHAPLPKPDTLKATAYFVAGQSIAASMEAFAVELIDSLLSRHPQLTGIDVALQSHLWKRLMIEGQPAPTAFMKGSDERQTTRVSRVRGGQVSIRSGFTGMTLLRTVQPAVSDSNGFNEAVLTTPPETIAGLSVTTVTAEWSFTPAAVAEGVDFSKLRHQLREHMISTFARGTSSSVQQMLQGMAEAALARTGVIDELFLRLSNSRPRPVDSERSEVANSHHIFVPTDELPETVEARVRRE